MKLRGCPVQLSSGFKNTGCVYGSVERPACCPVQVQTPRTTQTFHSLLSFQLSSEIWIYLLFLWPCMLCWCLFSFPHGAPNIHTHLYIIYLVLERGKHFSQLRLFLNVPIFLLKCSHCLRSGFTLCQSVRCSSAKSQASNHFNDHFFLNALLQMSRTYVG